MDKLKAKKEDRVSKEDAFLVLKNKAEKETLSADETAKIKSLLSEIEALDAEIELEEKAEEKAKKIAARQSSAKPNPNLSTRGAEQDNAAEDKELESIAKRFHLSKAFNRAVEAKQLEGVEEEVRQIAVAEAKESGIKLEGTISIPHKFIKIGNRSALTVGTEGTDVVFTEYGGKVIPYLNPVPVADALGVTFLQGLRGNVQWPRVTADTALAFETETSDVDETTPTFDNVSITPKRFGGYVDVTLQMLQQAVFVVEPWLRNNLSNRYAITVDQQIFNGSGSGNQTTGLFNISGVNTLSLGSGTTNDMTYRALLSMKRDCKASNTRIGSKGWVTNAYGEYALYNTPKQASGIEGNFILNADRPGTLVSDPFFTSEIIPSNFSEGSQTDLVGIAYSSYWQGLIAGFWGGMDLLVDPYTQRLGGKVRFVVNAFMDVDVEQPLEFAICKDWDASDLPALT
jgi:HK97 family phage major capsid protein